MINGSSVDIGAAVNLLKRKIIIPEVFLELAIVSCEEKVEKVFWLLQKYDFKTDYEYLEEQKGCELETKDINAIIQLQHEIKKLLF